MMSKFNIILLILFIIIFSLNIYYIFRKYKKNKYSHRRAKIAIFLLCLITLLNIANFTCLNISKNNIVQKNTLVYAKSNNKEYQKKNIEDTNLKVYLTLSDAKGRIVSTTNPETELDSIYKFTANSPPQTRINLEDDLLLSYDIVNFFDSEGNLLVDEETIYYTDIPSYIIPSEDIVVGTEHGPDGETRLYKSGNVECLGGVYPEGKTGYRLKFRFENTKDQTNIKFNYQILFNLSNTIKNQNTDLKTIDFDSLGVLQFWMKGEEIREPEETDPYTLQEYIESSSSGVLKKFVTTITDNRPLEERELKGTLKVDLSDGIGLSTDWSDWLRNVEIYADGQKLTYKSSSSNGGYYATDGSNIDVILNFEEYYGTIDYGRNSTIGTDSQCKNGSFEFSCLLKSISLNFGDAFGSNQSITGIKEWKIILKEKVFVEGSTVLNYISYEDKTQAMSKISTSIGTSSSVCSSCGNMNYSSTDGFYSTNSDYNLNFNWYSPGNYVEMAFDTSFHTSSGMYYYMSSKALAGSNYLSDTLRVNINGSEVEFERDGFHIPSVANGHNGAGDPALQLQMKRLFGYSYEDYFKDRSYCGYNEISNYTECVSLPKQSFFWKSKYKNSDGEYYWLVFDIDTIYNEYKFGYTTTGREEFTRYKCTSHAKTSSSCNTPYKYDESLNYNDKLKVKFYIFNVSSKNVKVTVPYKLGYTNRLQGKSDNLFSGNNNINYCMRGDYTKCNSYSISYFSNNATEKYMSIQSEKMVDEITKWQVTINTRELDYYYKLNGSYNSNWYITYFYLNLPNQLGFFNDNSDFSTNGMAYYYDSVTRSVKRGYASSTANKVWLNGKHIYSCLDTKCNELSQSSLTYFNDYYQYSSENYNLLNYDVIGSAYYGSKQYYAKINNLTNYIKGDTVRFVFFTKTKNNESNGNDYDNNHEIYFQLSTGGASVFNNSTYDGHGAATVNINYINKGIALNSGSIAKSGEEITDLSDSSTNKTSIKWSVSPKFNSSNASINGYSYLPAYTTYSTDFSGTYQFTEKFSGLPAQYTKLKRLIISGGSRVPKDYATSYNDYNSISIMFDENDLENYINEGVTLAEKCNNYGVCATISYNVDEQCALYKDCLVSKYGENYRETLRQMNNGFSVKVTGLLDVQSLNFDYYTETDNKLMFSDLKENNNLGLLTSDYVYTLKSEAKAFDWNVESSNYNNNRDLPTANAEVKSRLLADIYVNKSTEELSETVVAGRNYLSRDNIRNTVFTRVGYIPSNYIDVKDIILGFEQYSDRNNIDDTSYLITEKDKNILLLLKQYLEIKNLTITYCEHFNKTDTACADNGTIIYENNAFASGWENSYIKFENDTIDLYNVHLEKSDGTIPSTSGYQIKYDLVFDIDNTRQITDEHGNTLPSFRESKYYKGKYLDVISTVGSTRTYENDISEKTLEGENNSSTTEGNRHQELMDKYQSTVDKDNKTLTAYTTQEVQSGYLKNPYVSKTYKESAFQNNEFNWQITYDAYSTGKDLKPSIDLTDTYYFSLDEKYKLDSFTEAEQTKIAKLNKLLLEYSNYSDITLLYKDNIYHNQEYKKIYEISGTIENNKDYKFTLENNRQFIIKSQYDSEDEHSMRYQLQGISYDSSSRLEYKISIDFESFYQKALQEGLIDEECHIKGTDKTYIAVIKNRVLDNNQGDSLKKESTSGYINISTYKTKITKTILSQDNDKTKWQLKFNTGTSDKEINITDEVKVNGDDAVKKAISIGNLTISLGAEIIYENNTPSSGYENNIEVNKDGLTLRLKFKNSESNNYLNNNKTITVNYVTYLDENLYNEAAGKKDGTFNLSNEAKLEKGSIISKASAKTEDIKFDFPLEIAKTYLGNPNEDLTKTKWNIKLNTGTIIRKDVYISDIATIDENYQKYFHISDIKITSNKNGLSEVLYDSTKESLLPENIKIFNQNNENFTFNKNGDYNFIVYFKKLSNMTEISIDYTLSLDKEKYEYEKEVPDKTLNIKNVVEVKSDGVTGPSSSSEGNTMFPAVLKKTYKNNDKSKNNLPLIKWYADVNLAVDYGNSLTDVDQVILTDELDEILSYYNDTLKVYALETSATGTKVKNELIQNQDYNFTYENNTITITLLKPDLYNNFRVTFDTELLMSSNDLKNYLLLSVNGKTTVTDTSVSKVFNNIAGGTVTSQGITYYSFYAKKYLDNQLSEEPFRFKLESIDYEGNKIANATEIITRNDSNGYITFGPITYKQDGIYYYKISEINDGNNYNYDSNSYIVKVKVINYKYNYIVDEVTIIDNDSETIDFYNTTKEEFNNPNTSNRLSIFIIITILSIFIFLKAYKKKRELS